MKATDKSVLLGLGILGLLAAFWFLMLAPKREQAAELGTRVTELRTQVSEQEQLAASAAEAQDNYAANYERLVVLGKAAPVGGDTPSLLAQLSTLADRSGTRFGSLTSGGSTEAVSAPAALTTTDQNAAEGVPTAATPPDAAFPAPATEVSAALLPLGATVGPAGLGVMPYTLSFTGDFFEIADLLRRLDGQVGTGERTTVDGRLLTVNSFTMTPGDDQELSVDLEIMTYVLPGSQGLTAGGTPASPPATVPPAVPVPTSSAPAP